MLESLKMAFFVVILDSRYCKMTPKFVTQKSQWLHSSIKFANPAHKLVFESVLDISIIFRCTKRKQPVLLLTKFMSHSKHNFSNCLKYKNNISHTHQRWVNTIQLICKVKVIKLYCYIPRLSLNLTGTAIGWFLVTWPWLKSNVSRLWYIKQCTPLGLHYSTWSKHGGKWRDRRWEKHCQLSFSWMNITTQTRSLKLKSNNFQSYPRSSQKKNRS